MSFNKTKTTPKEPVIPTYNGGEGFKQDPRMELYRTCVTALLTGDSYYEKKDERIERTRNLISEVLKMKDGDIFLSGLAAYTRNEMFLRSSPTMLLAEMFSQKVPTSRSTARYVFLRGDEHVEGLAYLKDMGLKRPKQFLKAIADRLNTFSEYTADKYKLEGKSFTQRDALRLAHPEPKDPKQSALFKFIARGWDELNDAEKSLLPLIAKRKGGAALTWEQQLSTKGASKESWETIIPKMGYMALLRNLRNFIENNVSIDLINKIAEKLSDPKEVKESKQLPWRFINAYLVLDSIGEHSKARDILGRAIRKALDISIENVPVLDGKTLVLVDTSGSMGTELPSKPMPKNYKPDSNKPIIPKLKMMDIGTILGCIIMGQQEGELWQFATTTSKVNFGAGIDTMEKIKTCRAANGRNGHGTNIGHALEQATKGRFSYFNRVIILTDMQSTDDVYKQVQEIQKVNPKFNCYSIDLQGYEVSMLPKKNKCHQLAGFSPNIFKWISQNEAGENIINKITAIGKSVIQGTYLRKEDEDNEDEST